MLPLPENNLLIVGHFSAGVGYAWNTISEYFLALGKMFLKLGSRAYIWYPRVEQIPEKFQGTGIEIMQYDFFDSNLFDLYHFIKTNAIKVVYLTDRPVFSFRYLICRLAGVKKMVVHDRTSGDRDIPGLLKKWIKKVINHYPVLSADVAIAISEFVRNRLIHVNCFPEQRTVRIWNGVDIEKFKPGFDDLVYREFNIPRSKRIVFSYSRANRYKGIEILIDAARILIHEKKRNDLFFLYCGDGPDLEHFRSLVSENKLTDYFLCPGYSEAADRILKGVDVVVVPSLWQEGFGLSVIEGMASGKPVIASRVGGIMEIITDYKDGFLIPPGDSESLSAKISEIVDDGELEKRIGSASRRTAEKSFNIEDKKRELLHLLTDSIFDPALIDSRVSQVCRSNQQQPDEHMEKHSSE